MTDQLASSLPPAKQDRRKPLDRGPHPSTWTRECHPAFGRRSEVAIFERGSLASVDDKIRSGAYVAVKTGDSVLIDIESVFGYFDRLPRHRLTPASQPAAKGKRGRPRKE